MTRIVREHHPAADLPANLREGFEPDQIVRVVIEPVEERIAAAIGRRSFPLAELFALERFPLGWNHPSDNRSLFFQRDGARPSFANSDAVSAHMRDEWEDKR